MRRRSTTFTMAMRAASSPGCGCMQRMHTSPDSSGTSVSAAEPHPEGGDLAAAGGDVGEARGAETCQKARYLAPENVGREIYEHVAKFQLVVRRDHWKEFAADGNALLDNPG